MSPEPATVPLEVARVEAAARAVRLRTVLVPLWKAARTWTAAVVLALFPLLFVLDERVEFPLSPVLPGLAVLVLLLIGLPFALVEGASRRYRRKDADWQELHAVQAANRARGALGAAAIWVVVWFAVGT